MYKDTPFKLSLIPWYIYVDDTKAMASVLSDLFKSELY